MKARICKKHATDEPENLIYESVNLLLRKKAPSYLSVLRTHLDPKFTSLLTATSKQRLLTYFSSLSSVLFRFLRMFVLHIKTCYANVASLLS
jgi:hypothetical protein